MQGGAAGKLGKWAGFALIAERGNGGLKMRLIDADALKQYATGGVTSVGILTLVEIDNAPTVDAVPVVHGRWNYEAETLCTHAGFRCSACHGTLWLSPDVPSAFKHCPDCGARMDGE